MKNCRTALVNRDDPYFDAIVEGATAEILTFSLEQAADFTADDIHYVREHDSWASNFRRMDDMRAAASVLKGRKVAKGVRCIVIPATQAIYLQSMREGLLEIFIEAGAVVSTPTCGPCLGGYMGILAEGERCISTTNRNFVGRMGHVKSEVYLASPAVAAASAVTGKISAPAELGL
mgnify:CR=1 FL=1